MFIFAGMDIVYTLREDKQSHNTQLRYSLRGVVKHLKNYGNIYVVGVNPRLNNVIHIPYVDKVSEYRNAAHNIAEKLLAAAAFPGISQRFLYMADDYFLLQDIDAEQYPYYTNGSLKELAQTQNSWYANLVMATSKALAAEGKGQHNFNLHAPFIYDKDELPRVYNAFDWRKRGLLIKSLYGNMLGLGGGNEMKDCKVAHDRSEAFIRRRTADRIVFSTGNESRFPQIMQYVHSLYPQKSCYE